MKLTVPSIGVLATVIVLASVGAIYAISFDSGFASFAQGDNIPTQSSWMVGNLKVTHFDENGEVIGYRHGSNHITATGMSIIMGQVFVDVNASYPDQGNLTSGRVSHMQIGYAGDVGYTNELRWNNTDIIDGVGGAACKRIRVQSIQNLSQGAAHPSPSTCIVVGDRTDCAAQMNVTAIAQFQGADCSGAGTIDEAGIYTGSNPSGNLMFARNTFGSVVLGAMDTLQLEWEFTFKDTVP